MKTICYLLAIALSLNLVSCSKSDLGSRLDGFSVPDLKSVVFDNSAAALSEVAPPNVIQKLSQNLALNRPQVAILYPYSEEILQDTTVEVRLTVDNLAIFKDDRLGMGNHLHLILDNEPYGEIYSLAEPIFLTDLKPGTHSLRVLAEKPWHESFKNPEAYDWVNFSVLTETEANHLDDNTPLLTYNQPNGVYSAEPILLDFYLSNVSQHNWQVKAKINEEVFTIDEWQPIYLTGFVPGNNLIELELQDQEGKRIKNSFNKTIRLITYQDETGAQDEDTLALLMKDRIAFETAIAIADPNYYIQPVGAPKVKAIIEEDLPAISEPVEEDIEAIEAEDTTESLVKSSKIIPENTEMDTEELPQELDVESTTKVLEPIDNESLSLEEETDSATKEVANSEIITTPTPKIQPKLLVKNESISLPATPEQKSVSTTSVKQENPSVKQDRQLLLEEVAEIPVEEQTETEIVTEETEADSISVNTPPSNPTVSQWWQKLVANLQQLKEIMLNRVNEIFSNS